MLIRNDSVELCLWLVAIAGKLVDYAACTRGLLHCRALASLVRAVYRIHVLVFPAVCAHVQLLKAWALAQGRGETCGLPERRLMLLGHWRLNLGDGPIASLCI